MEEKNIKILLIEDNMDDAELMKRRLARSANARFTVVAVKTLQDGMAQLEQYNPDLIIADLGLPDSFGLDTVTKILSKAPQTPLVVLSGFDDEATAIKAVKAGAQDYLVKGQLEGFYVERSLFYAIERSRMQRKLEDHAQEILAIQTNLLKILEKNADAIIVVGEGRRILFTNPAVETLLGRGQKELINQPFDYPLDGGRTTEIEIARPDKAKTVAEMRVVDITWEGKPAYLASLRNVTERKRAEAALRESEEKFSKAFRSSPEAIIIARFSDSTILEANDTFFQTSGYTREEVIGKKSTELDVWAKQEDRARMVKSLREKGAIRNEEHILRNKSGELRTKLFSAELINISNEPCVLSVTIDITERKRAEEALRESEEKFSKAFRSSPEVIVISRLSDSMMLEVNDTFLRITGYTREEVTNIKVTELGMWAKPEERIGMVKTLKEKGIIRNEEYLFRMKSGEIRTWLFSAEIATINNESCILSVATDITERKKAEEALRFSDAAFKSIHESVIAMDANFTITHWNKISEQIYGIEAAQAIGKKLLDVIEIAENYTGENENRFKTLDANGYYRGELLNRTKHGEVWVDVSFQAIEDGQKRYGWVALATAITNRKLAEEALKRSEEKYREIISTSIDGIISTDQQMRVMIWNSGAEKIYGYTEKEMLGQSLMKIIPEKDRKVLAKGFAKLNKTGSLNAINDVNELTGLKKDGSEIPIELSLSLRKSGENSTVTIIIRDITERKEAEEALGRSEEKYRTIFENTGTAIAIIETDTTISMVNDEFARITGSTKNNIEGKVKWTDLVHKTDLEKMSEFHRLRREGAAVPKEYEFKFHDKAGRIKDASIIVSLIPETKQSLVSMTDITERKEAEEKLRESEERYRDLFENASDLIQSVSLDGHYIYVNKAWRQALGYTEKEIKNLTIWDIIHSDHLAHCQEIFQKVISGEANYIETAFLTKNGKVIYVEGNANTYSHEGKIIATRGIFRDNTERKLAEEKLRESEERYRDLFENASDLIQSCGRDEHFVYVNKAWREALGYSEKEIDNLILWDIIHPDYLSRCKVTFRKVMSGKTVNNIEMVFVAKDGRLIQVEGNVNSIFKEGKVVATRAIFRDITERKEAEEKMRKIDQMKSEFLSNVSHELRTPLQSIGGFTKLIMNGQVPDPATQQEFLQIIDREALHLGNLINGLLDMSRLESGRFQINRKLIPVRDYFIDPVKSFHSLARDKNITLSENIPERLPEMEVDGERLRQVVINLLGNAIKFSDPGGSVAIKVEKQKDQLLFQVSDHGIGISEEAQSHIFERFYRAEGEMVRGGTGLGLYISKQIIEAHGGHIWADSKIGEGSTFSFTLPLNGKGGKGNGKENPSH